jgi:FMN-dependent oxidoreductase (nitrilotriacetate monooxygenase family)
MTVPLTGILPADRPNAGGRQNPDGVFRRPLALPDIYTGNHVQAVAASVRAVKMDPCTILMAMGLATQRLGLGATYSTTYYEPFRIARVFTTIDLMLKGRVAWNVVTSLNSAEARNFGQREHMEDDARYDRADEFMEVVLGHWNTWEDDALILDKATGRFADPAKVHRLDYQGRYFRSRGPFSVPRSPQGQPVLIQAGQSGRGQAFAAKWADLVFVIFHNLQDASANTPPSKRRSPPPGVKPQPCASRRPAMSASVKARRRRRISAPSSKPESARHRRTRAALGGAELRLCQQANRRAVHR